MSVSAQERVAHVIRRLSMGIHPDVVAKVGDTDGAIDAALDLSAPAAAPLVMKAPADYDTANNPADIAGPLSWWVDRMRSSPRLVEERLVWFWHDHFATSLAKVRVPYLMYTQHLTLRQYATGSFAELLHAVVRDPAMLTYLDGVTNAATQRNENFGREFLELFTMGRDGGYTQDDVVAMSRAFTGWTVNVPGRNGVANGTAWTASLVARRHDTGVKTLLGKTGSFDADGAVDIVLGHPATATFVTRKLYRELVGLEPPNGALDRLAAGFRKDYKIMPLVRAIASEPAFTSDAAVRAKYRSPIEKLIGILHAAPPRTLDLGRLNLRGGARGGVSEALRTMSFLPFVPPNVGGFPKGTRLAGPHNLVHGFDLLQAAAVPTVKESVPDLFARFGIHDVSDRSVSVVAKEPIIGRRVALVVGSPEFSLT